MSNIEIDLGPVRPLHKGDYSPTATYELNNIVSHGGTSWWMKKEPYVVGSTPTKGSEYWGLLAEGNAQGVIVDGDTIIIEDGNLKVPTATADKLGISKPDNSTIKIKDDGTLVVTGIEFPELPDGGTSTTPPITGDKVQIATIDNVGVVKPDGKTVQIDTDGTLKVVDIEFPDSGEGNASIPGDKVEIATVLKVGVSKPDGNTLLISKEGVLSVSDDINKVIVVLLNDYTLPPTIGIGKTISFDVTATSLLSPTQSIKEFIVNIPELNIVNKIVEASENTASISIELPLGTAPDTVYNVSVYAIDVLGNKSKPITKTTTTIEVGIATPIITSPTPQEEVSRQSITIQTQSFNYIGLEDTHKDTDWKITSDAEGNTVIVQDLNSSDLLQHTFTTPGVTIGQTYYVWCRYQGNQHGYSKWAKVEVRILTPTIKAPTIVSPTANSRVPKIGFTATVSGFGVVEDGETDTHKSTDWKLTNKLGNKTYQENLNDTTNKLSFKFNSPDTTDLGEAKLMVRFNGTDLGAGQWLEVPLNIIEAYVETPTITAPSVDDTIYHNITMVLNGYKIIPDSITDIHKSTSWILSRDAQGEDIIQQSLNDTANLLSYTFTNIEGLTDSGFNVYCHAIQHSTNYGDSEKVTVKVLLKKGTTTSAGRIIYRHESNEGTVIEYKQDSETRRLLVLDAYYRGKGKWSNANSDTSITNMPKSRYATNSLTPGWQNAIPDSSLDELGCNDKRYTGANNTDILISTGSSAASVCRDITSIQGFEKGFDLPTIREGLVIYTERNNIDALDPTGDSYPTWKLGETNSHGDWYVGDGANAMYCSWTCCEYDTNQGFGIRYTGDSFYGFSTSGRGENKQFECSVIPVKELTNM